MKRICVVAHPDDEVLWAGGLIMQNAGEWTVMCVSIPRADPVRAKKFKDSCRILGAEARLIDWQEPAASEQMTHLNEIDLSEFDHILTHNAWGEYGHVHHRCVHQWVRRKWGNKKISTFGYRYCGEGVHKLVLSEFEEARKMKALRQYDHESNYEGRTIPKWQALYERYIEKEGIPFAIETYDGAKL